MTDKTPQPQHLDGLVEYLREQAKSDFEVSIGSGPLLSEWASAVESLAAGAAHPAPQLTDEQIEVIRKQHSNAAGILAPVTFARAILAAAGAAPTVPAADAGGASPSRSPSPAYTDYSGQAFGTVEQGETGAGAPLPFDWDAEIAKSAKRLRAEAAASPAPSQMAGAGAPLPSDPMLDCEIEPRPLRYPLRDYHCAPSDGPLNFTWQDKPHRLLYDLIAAVRYYAGPPASSAPGADTFQRSVYGCGGDPIDDDLADGLSQQESDSAE